MKEKPKTKGEWKMTTKYWILVMLLLAASTGWLINKWVEGERLESWKVGFQEGRDSINPGAYITLQKGGWVVRRHPDGSSSIRFDERIPEE